MQGLVEIASFPLFVNNIVIQFLYMQAGPAQHYSRGGEPKAGVRPMWSLLFPRSIVFTSHHASDLCFSLSNPTGLLLSFFITPNPTSRTNVMVQILPPLIPITSCFPPSCFMFTLILSCCWDSTFAGARSSETAAQWIITFLGFAVKVDRLPPLFVCA